MTMLEGVYADPVAGNRLVPLQCDAQGRLVVSGAGGGGGGSSDTTEATQLAVKTAVQAIDIKTPALSSGAVPVALAAGGYATAAKQDLGLAALGAPADAAAASDAGAASLIAMVKRALQNWTSLFTRLPAALGAATSANSLPVVIASDQSVVGTVPRMTSGGHLSVTTAASGTAYTAFAGQLCKQLTILNGTGVDIGVTVNGVGVEVPVLAGTYFTFFGITNATQLSVRRVDTSTTQVTVVARWES